MSAISTNNQALLAYPRHRIGKLKLNVWKAEVYATARINGSYGQGDYPRANFTVDGVSADWTSGVVGQRVVISSGANGTGTIRYEGTLRTSPTSTTLKIAEIAYGYPGLARETWSHILDNDYVTVYTAVLPCAFETRATVSGSTVTLYKLYDVVFDATYPQTAYPKPQINIGGWKQYDWTGSTFTETFSFADSFSWVDGTPPDSWSAGVRSGNATIGTISLGGQTIEVDFTDTGQACVSYAGTDSAIPIGATTRSGLAVRYYWVNDDTDYPAFSDEYALEILSDTISQNDGGRVMGCRATGTGVTSELYYGQPMLLTYNLYTGNKSIPTQDEWRPMQDELERISFEGYVSAFSVSVDSEGVETVEFTIENALKFSERLLLKGLSLRGQPDILNTRDWTQVLIDYSYPSAIIKGYIFDWHAPSLPILHDYYREEADTGGTYTDSDAVRQFPSIADGTIAQAVRLQAAQFRTKGVLCMSSDGAFYMREPRNTSTAPYYVHQWTDAEVLDRIEYERDISPKIAAVIGQAVIPGVYEATYGLYTSKGLGSDRITSSVFVAVNDDDAKQITGDLAAEAEAGTPTFSLAVFGNWGDACNVAHHEYHSFDLSAYDPLALMDAQYATLTAISNTWSSESGAWVRDSLLTFKPVFTGKKATGSGITAPTVADMRVADKAREVFVFTDGEFNLTSSTSVILSSPYADGDDFTVNIYCYGSWSYTSGGADTGFYVNGVQMTDYPCTGDSSIVTQTFASDGEPVVIEWNPGTPAATVTGVLWIEVIPA